MRDIEEQNKEHELDKGIRASAENHRDEEDLQLLTEEEINQIAEQYGSVNLKMDEDMLDEDDLLDEPEIPETQVVPETFIEEHLMPQCFLRERIKGMKKWLTRLRNLITWLDKDKNTKTAGV